MDRNNQIDYIEFTATDIASTKTFYNAVFGWSFTDYGPDYTSFSDGRIAGGFQKGKPQTGCGPLVVIHVDDLSSAELLVQKAGGSISKETFSFPGGSRFHFRDPSGNELAVWHQD